MEPKGTGGFGGGLPYVPWQMEAAFQLPSASSDGVNASTRVGIEWSGFLSVSNRE